MFSGCSSLTVLDISNFASIAKVTNMDCMFMGCSSLTKITVWALYLTPPTGATGDNMFKDCTSLVGGNGTAYNSSNTGISYARIDSSARPGYFTKKSTSSGGGGGQIII